MKYFQLLILLFLISCGSMTKEEAFEMLCEKGVYNSYFYAPMHIGRQVVTLDDGVSLENYISERYDSLINSGLIEIEVQKKSSWRNVYMIKLTEKGKNFSDASRSDDEHAFVAVCKVVPVRVDSLIPIENSESLECRYTIEQRDITPFGRFLEFENGRQFPVIDTIQN